MIFFIHFVILHLLVAIVVMKSHDGMHAWHDEKLAMELTAQVWTSHVLRKVSRVYGITILKERREMNEKRRELK